MPLAYDYTHLIEKGYHVRNMGIIRKLPLGHAEELFLGNYHLKLRHQRMTFLQDIEIVASNRPGMAYRNVHTRIKNTSDTMHW